MHKRGRRIQKMVDRRMSDYSKLYEQVKREHGEVRARGFHPPGSRNLRKN